MRWIPALLLSVSPCVADASLFAPTPSNETEARIVQSDRFLATHPDISYRLQALDKLDRGDLAGAVADLTVAARHADKASQAILGEMYWTGRGVTQDRALGYIWMDLAGERGYPLPIAKREAYWAALDEATRRDALARGGAYLAEYGDDAARPRLDVLMQRARRGFRESRAHSVGARTVNILVGGRFRGVDASAFMADRYWTPDGYYAWQDAQGHGYGRGQVDVGAIEAVDRVSDAGD